MGLPTGRTLVTATVELRFAVTVTVPLPDGVTVEDIGAVASAVDAMAALPQALKASLEAAAASADGTGTAVGDIHYIWVCRPGHASDPGKGGDSPACNAIPGYTPRTGLDCRERQGRGAPTGSRTSSCLLRNDSLGMAADIG